jgi:dCTP deaminase
VEEILASGSLFAEFREREVGRKGILPSQDIRELIKNGIISPCDEDQIQPASIDLRLSREAYKVRASFLPRGQSTTLLNKARASKIFEKQIDISEPTLLEPGDVYIIRLKERLVLPSDIFGIANPKSTTGRLDIFTRLITEVGDEFDRVPMNYRGDLYIEVVSQTFRIIVQAGMKLNQLRFVRDELEVANDAELQALDKRDQYGRFSRESSLIEAEEGRRATIDRGLKFHVDLEGNGSGIVAYQAIKSPTPIDLSRVAHYEIAEFWTTHYKDAQPFILTPGEFYILASKELVRIRTDFAAEMTPYDFTTQEFRVHYAGFFDPGFGYGTQGEIPATRAVLEVRASQVPILLEDDQFVGRLNYHQMSATPDKVYGGPIGSSYQQQGLALSKQFKQEQQYVSSSATELHPTKREKPANRREGLTKSQSIEQDDDDEGTILSLAFPGTSGERRLEAKTARPDQT